jgi:hypothetical protein
MADLARSYPELWGDQVCCEEWRMLALHCIESSGYMAGALDIIKAPNDGKMAWRNFERARFGFCPFCGAELAPDPRTFARERLGYAG